ncbi:hypothetical protein COB52_05790 [Candidatus Kaiserbacteria bacterium]|nr:MAG: hypothetical protein COB52_05790 [Candidatus Kaiserbacteria bacterium]
MKFDELGECLQLLVGEQLIQKALPNEISADEFAENVLGFEEVEEADDEEIIDGQLILADG